jgi:hypothetical protein
MTNKWRKTEYRGTIYKCFKDAWRASDRLYKYNTAMSRMDSGMSPGEALDGDKDVKAKTPVTDGFRVLHHYWDNSDAQCSYGDFLTRLQAGMDKREALKA